MKLKTGMTHAKARLAIMVIGAKPDGHDVQDRASGRPRARVLEREGALVDGQHRLGKPWSASIRFLLFAPVIAPGPQWQTVLWCDLGGAHQRGSGLVEAR